VDRVVERDSPLRLSRLRSTVSSSVLPVRGLLSRSVSLSLLCFPLYRFTPRSAPLLSYSAPRSGNPFISRSRSRGGVSPSFFVSFPSDLPARSTPPRARANQLRPRFAFSGVRFSGFSCAPLPTAYVSSAKSIDRNVFRSGRNTSEEAAEGKGKWMRGIYETRGDLRKRHKKRTRQRHPGATTPLSPSVFLAFASCTHSPRRTDKSRNKTSPRWGSICDYRYFIQLASLLTSPRPIFRFGPLSLSLSLSLSLFLSVSSHSLFRISSVFIFAVCFAHLYPFRSTWRGICVKPGINLSCPHDFITRFI